LVLVDSGQPRNPPLFIASTVTCNVKKTVQNNNDIA